MKADFETIVRENTAWILKYVRSKISNKDICEDIVQDVWMKAFRAYDNYSEQGKIRPWLMRITQNAVRNHRIAHDSILCISIDAKIDDNDPIGNFLSDDLTPEEEYLKRELTNEVLSAVSKLPWEQREIVTLRYIYGFPVNETSRITGIPEGSVKSKSHYAIKELRKNFGIPEKRKGDKNMDCAEIKKYLFMYALGKISNEKKKVVDEHLSKCKVCSNAALALKKLITHINVEDDVEYAHCFIHIPEIDAFYISVRTRFENVEEANKWLEEKNGDISDQSEYMKSVWTKIVDLKCMFDNDGNELPWSVVGEADTHKYYKADYLKKVYENNWQYFMLTSPDGAENKTFDYTPSKEKPGKFISNAGESFTVSIPMKSMRYQAIPADAKNIKMRRGSGIIDCGTYKFAYSDRYVCDNDMISLEYTFELD
ncbi:MAG: sigma-70 family RNA polymerase sigma factor [Ruminococcaceae bacterium]|nr:sigma-70 family RNA polymerase sigma factor [Oscillospiraceae bacterium]